MSSAVPIGRGSTRRSLSSFHRSRAKAASSAAPITQGQGPRQNLRVGSQFHSRRTTLTRGPHGSDGYTAPPCSTPGAVASRPRKPLALAISLTAPARRRLRPVGSAREGARAPGREGRLSGLARAAAGADRSPPRRSRSALPLRPRADRDGGRGPRGVAAREGDRVARLAREGRPGAGRGADRAGRPRRSRRDLQSHPRAEARPRSGAAAARQRPHAQPPRLRAGARRRRSRARARPGEPGGAGGRAWWRCSASAASRRRASRSKSSRRSIATTASTFTAPPHSAWPAPTFAKEKGEPELAEERYEACLERFPTEPLVLSRSDRLLRRDRPPGALRGDPRARARARARGIVVPDRRWRCGSPPRAEIDEAEALLRAGTEVASPAEAAEAWAVVASFNVDHGDLDDAIAAFARARQLDDSPRTRSSCSRTPMRS